MGTILTWVYLAVQYVIGLTFISLLFLVMVIYDNEIETKEDI